MRQTKDAIKRYDGRLLKHRIFAVAILLLLGAIALGFGFGDKRERTVAYDESGSSVSYKVHLKPNNTYDSSYIIGSPDRSYPTSLIDHIDLNYNYSIDFAEAVEGNISYRLVALTNADKVDGSTTSRLWSEEHDIVASKEVHLEGSSFNLSENTEIVYDTYADILRNFEKEARGVSARGTLNVALVISGNVKPASFTNAVPVESRIDFTIPIASNSSVEAVTNSRSAQASVLREQPEHIDAAHFVSIVVGFIMLAIALVISLHTYIERRRIIAAHPYEENIRKLLSAYDGIIVEVSSAPVFKNTSVSDVDDFDELLDAYNSIHLPINFYQTNKASYFVISGEKNSWRYIVSKSDFE